MAMSTAQTDFYDQMATTKWLKSANKWYNQPIIDDEKEEAMKANLNYPDLDPEEEEAMLSINTLNAIQGRQKDAINPDHYKSVAAGKQYIELMHDLLKGYSGVEAHLLGQIYKYSMRLGKKDSKEQDATKISWYAQCLANYYRTGKVTTGWK
jgi:hypothetical protein